MSDKNTATKSVNNKLSRKEAEAIYDTMHNKMTKILKNVPEGRGGVAPGAKAASGSAGSTRSSGAAYSASAGAAGSRVGRGGASLGGNQGAASASSAGATTARRSSRFSGSPGQRSAVFMVIGLAVFKVLLSGLEAMGVGSVEYADAAMQRQGSQQVINQQLSNQQLVNSGKFSPEEVAVLSALDSRRAELEKRSKRLDQKEEELKLRDQESAVRLTQLRDLTNRLKLDRESNETEKRQKMEQLANVYSSMNPPEAAGLMEQLDVTIALELLSKLPEKRIAQILGLMRQEKALMLTKMMSERVR